MKIKALNLFYILIVFVMYFIYLIMYNLNTLEYSNISFYIWLASFLGLILYVFSIYVWKKNTGNILDLYTIFLTLLFIFNFGQCLFWTFGLHLDNELGKSIYANISIDKITIIKSQLLSISGLLFFNLGAVIRINKLGKNNNSKTSEDEISFDRKCIYYTCIILSLFVIPISFILFVKKYQIASLYGYKALYYGEYSNFGLIPTLISRMFFPCLFGLLVGSNYNKRTWRFVLVTFVLYVGVALLCGERGDWIYALLIMIYIYNSHISKIKIRKLVIICFIGIIFLNLVDSIVSVRNIGISFSSIKESFNIENNVVIKNIFEMGGTMGIQSILIKNGWKIFPYGNTYLLSFLGVITDKIFPLLNINYVDLSSWFNSQYLRLNGWGVGFSMIAESLLNFGPYLSPLFMALLGYVFTYLFTLKDFYKKPFYTMISLISVSTLVLMIRGIFSYNFKVFFFTIVVFVFSYFIIKSLMKKKHKEVKS